MLSTACPKQITRHADRRRKALDEQAELREVYALVDHREGARASA